MFVKVNYKEKSYLFKSDLVSLEGLIQAFKASAKLPEDLEVTLEFFDEATSEHTTLVNDSSLTLLKQKMNDNKLSLLILTASEASDEVKKSSGNDSDSETEVVRNDEEHEEFQIVSEPRSPPVKTMSEKKKEIDEEQIKKTDAESQQDTEKEQKKKKSAQRIKKIVSKEIQKTLPSLTEQIKKQIMQELNKGNPQNAPQNTSESTQRVIHSGFICDSCEASPIIGVRYKCSSCPDYDLCEKCEAANVHSHHSFLKIKDPNCAPKYFVSVEADEEAQRLLNQMSSNSSSQVIDIDINQIIRNLSQGIQTAFNPQNTCPRQQSMTKKDKKPDEKKVKKEKKEKTEKKDKEEKKEKKGKKEKKEKKEKKKETEEPQVNRAETNPIPQEAVQLASILGGIASEFIEICQIMKGCSIEEIIESLLAEKEEIQPVSERKVEERQPENLVEGETITNKKEEVSSSTPLPAQQSKVEESIDSEESNEVKTAKTIALVVDDSASEFTKYLEMVRMNPNVEVETLIEKVLNEQEKQCAGSESTNTQTGNEEQPTEKKEMSEPKVSDENQFPPRLREKAEMIASIMGGRFQNYINIILNLPARTTIEEIIDQLFSQNGFENNNQSNTERKQDECKQEKKEEMKEEQQPISIPEEQKRKLKKKYSEGTKKRATLVAEVLGGDPEIYYGICDAYCITSVEEIIGMLLQNSSLIESHSSYQ